VFSTASPLVVVHPPITTKTTAPASGLSPRQRQIFELIMQGRSNKEIARALQLAEGTVKVHVAALFTKLGVKRRAALACAAWADDLSGLPR
jgi:DNA-binding NarL/FixJ family response regulator